MERLPTGIPGLDPLIQGGIPKGFIVLVSGTTGSGKTTFLLQYCYEGLKRGEKAYFVSFEQRPEDLILTGKTFGMDFERYIEDGKFKIEYYRPIDLVMSEDWKEIIYKIVGEIKHFRPSRVAIDGLSVLLSLLKSEWERRRFVMELYLELKYTGATVLLTSEIPEGEENKLSRYGVEEFVVDGIIILIYSRFGEESFGAIQIRKMRYTKHAHSPYPLHITERGLKVGEEPTMIMK